MRVGRAAYGEELLERLGSDLSARFGRGFSRQNLQSMRLFYATYREQIRQTLSGKSQLAELAARLSDVTARSSSERRASTSSVTSAF